MPKDEMKDKYKNSKGMIRREKIFAEWLRRKDEANITLNKLLKTDDKYLEILRDLIEVEYVQKTDEGFAVTKDGRKYVEETSTGRIQEDNK